ncbi:MAG: hypothetical protein COW85_00750 [Ignavibacteria bacterium CG22_combo_CG10-13_8_21_14_all_37_15]|nr:hypothetical protein [Ignavibacteria bacterium]OIO22690.1 MAG: hypothetical protein AUJ54_03010 [Ignavibacteria bacterium CG1_02_37_35]PIP79545.1 MAG: hypothetical protein COW85_00750 [Ignavibacteria bacterium CG22_combo_CG10-13_8_21_14_all_37_15]PIS44175.1 MAG: hypothetical protein COT22_11930 [Ignavibacteria bacterium CG08_land_8_20_14_0_20_37_9]PJC57926.1 MAG: hypothetical protein CO025_10900 [Ignavibacteria bacterium CG_4_9_14_0_2_um_filter_37_13]
MKILLDIDDTALITKDRGKTWSEHPLLRALINQYDVVLYSGNPEIAKYHKEWKTKGYIPKGSDYLPKAEVLIDNDSDLWKETVEVKKCYKSIDSFLKSTRKQK